MRGKANIMATVSRSRSARRLVIPAAKQSEFPDLPLIIRKADGSERTVYIPDPRAAYATHYEADGDDGTCHAPESTPRTSPVVIVERPEGWAPKHHLDVPPNVEVYHAESVVFAEARASGFNMHNEQRNDWWAIVPALIGPSEGAAE